MLHVHVHHNYAYEVPRSESAFLRKNERRLHLYSANSVRMYHMFLKKVNMLSCVLCTVL